MSRPRVVTTGLPNRRLFNEHLGKVLARSRRKEAEFAVLFIDIDNFELFNDTIGHQAADEVLRELARSLGLLIRAEGMLGLYHEGVKLALDDFGTGYSSLSYLKSFPIDTVKIDRSFVAEMLTDHTTASIVEAIVSMTRILGLSVVAVSKIRRSSHSWNASVAMPLRGST